MSEATSGQRSLKDEFALAPFTDDEKTRLSGLIEKQGIVAHIIKTYVVDTVEYKNGFRKGEKISGFRNATAAFDQQAPAKILKYLSDPDHGRYHKCWEDLYRPSATLFLQTELPNLWRMLNEVTAPQGVTERTELLRALCVNALSFNVLPSDVERFYAAWPGPRTTELSSLLPLCLKRDEATAQRLTVARLEREVAALQQRITELPPVLSVPAPTLSGDDNATEQLDEDIRALDARVGARLAQLSADVESAIEQTALVAKQADARIVGLANELHEQARQVSERLREHATGILRAVSAQVEKRSESVAGQVAALSASVREYELRLSEAEARARTEGQRIKLADCLPPGRATLVADVLQLRQALSANFKACEVSPTSAVRLHAALASQLFAIVTGASAFSALTACSRATCGGRIATMSIAPSTTDLTDLLSRRVEFFGNALPLSDFLIQVREITGPVLLVLEGMNRAPTESYLLPLLLFRRLGKRLEGFSPDSTGFTESPWPRNLWLAGTAVQGPTTLPLSRDLLAHSAVLEATPYQSDPAAAPAPTEVLVEGDLCAPFLDTPKGVEVLDEAHPDVRAALPSARRLARHLARFETDPARLIVAIVEAIAAPIAASLEDEEERQLMGESLQTVVGHDAESLGGLIRRLRRLVV